MKPIDPAAYKAAIAEALPLAQSLFDELAQKTGDGVGIRREPYQKGEQFAHDLLARTARSLELEITTDRAGNLYMNLPGRDRSLPRWITGSHLDSVPSGGNYDGAAGVVAGITVLAALRRAGIAPVRDVTVMGIRAEELSSWYAGDHDGHIGARAALGMLREGELEAAVHPETGRTLAAQMALAGFDAAAVAGEPPHLAPSSIHGYVELHIEQGPVLERRGVPTGVVTAIRGASRARGIRCTGEYTHSGAVPHEYRSDAVLASVELIHELDRLWERVRGEGEDLVFTVGKLYTDPAVHSLTKVPGEANFTIDFRSQDEAVLARVTAEAERLAREIGARRRVAFDLGKFSLHRPAQMDERLRARLIEGCRELSIPMMEIASGAGHDAQDFAAAGIPSAMVFVRNAHGSHNPKEAMDMTDFALGTEMLGWLLLSEPG